MQEKSTKPRYRFHNLFPPLDDDEVADADAVPVPALVLVPVLLLVLLAAWSLTTTYISPEASEDMKSRPCLSKAIPTGLNKRSARLK